MARRCHQAREAARSWRGGLTRPLALLASLLSAAPAAAQAPLPFGVWWHAPFFSGGGYSSEAIGFATALKAAEPELDLQLSQHGDAYNLHFFEGLDYDTRSLLYRLSTGDPVEKDEARAATVVVCHSEPGAWAPSLFSTPPCPPVTTRKPQLVIGRTTFETDRLGPVHVQRCNAMDEVWVPTEFNRRTFVSSGVDAAKVHVVPEPVDVDFFDPATTEAAELPLEGATLVLGPKSETALTGSPQPAADTAAAFRFLSVFKWEARKGCDVLMRAFVSEFSSDDPVALYVLTNAFHTKKLFSRELRRIAAEADDAAVAAGGVSRRDRWPRVYLLEHHVPTVALPALYKAMHALVQPSRGEGWGRPHVEAMAMALPVIATNWSGPTEYMTDSNSYPLRTHGLVEITQGAFAGHRWAEPCAAHLRELMRHVATHRHEAAARGATARDAMVRLYAPATVAAAVMRQLRRVATAAAAHHHEL